MAYTQRNETKTIEFDTNGGMGGARTSFFNFADLDTIREKFRELHGREATGFRVHDGVLDKTFECAFLILVTDKSETGGFVHDKPSSGLFPGDWVGISCPRLVDAIGGQDYDDMDKDNLKERLENLIESGELPA